MDESNIRAIAARTAELQPRVFALVAPPGYGKRSFIRQYLGAGGRFNVCDLSAPGHEPTRLVLDALVATHPSRASRSAADRLVQRRPATTLREVLRREWALNGEPELFAFYDPALMLAAPAGLDLLSELIHLLPTSRTLAICMRPAMPPALHALIMQARAPVVGTEELALELSDVRTYATAAGVADSIARAVYECAQGWPLASALLIDLARSNPVGDLLDAARALPTSSLLPFTIHRTIASLPAAARELLAVVTVTQGTDYARAVRILGEVCDDFVFDRVSKLPFIEHERGCLTMHPIASGLLRERFKPLMTAITERVLNVLIGDGYYAEAARIALELGEAERAAAIIDAAPPYTAARVVLSDYERVTERIDRGLITRYPNLWIATIPYRSLSIAPETYVREAETVYFCLPTACSIDQRAAALMLLASAYVNASRAAEGERLIDEALRGFASQPTTARASILNFAAALRGIEGRFALARELAQEAATISQDGFGQNQTLHYVEAHEAAYRGQQRRAAVILDELMARYARENLPLYFAYAATNGMIISWANGDDVAFQRYLTALEESVTPGLEVGFAPLIDAAREWPGGSEIEHPWPVVTAMAQLYRMGSAQSDEDARRAARFAARAADERADPYTRILSHAALYVLDDTTHEREADLLKAIVQPVESAELTAAVIGLISGGSAGMLEPFVRLRVRRQHEATNTQLRIELLAGRVTRSGEQVVLNKRQFDLLALLASNRGSLSRESIGEALWDHLDPENWGNNAKVTVNRIRKKLGHEAIVVDEGTKQYRLGPGVEVDLRRLEGYVRQPSLPADLKELFGTFQCDTTAYEQTSWGQSLAVRIKDVYCTVGLLLAKAAFEGDDYDSAHDYAAAVSRVDGFNEQACEFIVRIKLHQGAIDDARRCFERYARGLQREFGVEPSRRFSEIAAAVASASPVLLATDSARDRSERPSGR